MGSGPACTNPGVFSRSQLVFTVQEISRESVPRHHETSQLLGLHKKWLGTRGVLSEAARVWPMTPLFSGLPIGLRSSDSFGDPGTLGICEVQSLGQNEERPKSGSGLDPSLFSQG